MKERLPERVDPVRLARRGVRLEGVFELLEMERLAGSLADTRGEVRVTLDFGSDAQRIPYIRVRLDTELMLECQSCLGPYRLSVKANSLVGIVASEAEAERLPDDYEPLLVGEEPLFVKELVEDELILALPVIARHPEGECAGEQWRAAGSDEANDNGPDATNPFRVLAGLRKNGKTDEES